MSDDELPFPLLFARPVEAGVRDFDLAGALARLRRAPPTGRRDQVLIITTRWDDHADEVMLELMSRGVPVRRMNVDEFPGAQRLTIEFAGAQPRAALTSASGETVLDEVRSVWMRRPIIAMLPTGAARDASEALARREAENTLRGLMSFLGHATWVNPLDSLWAAESKVNQLRIAASDGWTIPRTLVSNDPERVREFYRACGGRVIVKVFRGQVGPRTNFQMIYTSRVLPEHLVHFDRIRHAPSIFQEEVTKEAELRVTIIGQRIFPVEIQSESSSLDWRDDTARVSYRATSLPQAVEAACWRLVHHWQLASAAIDMIRRPTGEYVFLEINAHNDWLWLQRITGLQMIAAMADLLVSGALP